MKFLFLLACILLSCCGYGDDMPTSLLKTHQTWEHQIEIFLQAPQRKHSPLLVFLHGAGTDKGIKSLSNDWIDHWSKKGYATAAISLPGFGQTTGRKDFCGPFTLQCLHFALDAIKEKLGVSDFGIIGFGQGSIAALLLATERPDIHCVVSSNGCYDVLSHLKKEDPLCKALLAKNYAIAFDEPDFILRSPLAHVSNILSKVFVLHREGNLTIPLEEAIQFVDAMRDAGKECTFSILPPSFENPEKITYEEILTEAEAWIDAQMKN
jgi:dipeptidyl aminopeptidase/acylaminoacyl peptidase